MDVKSVLEKYKIVPDQLKDQYFLRDDSILNNIVKFSDLKKEDTVLEIGAGIGNLTEKLAEGAGKVVTFEIDERFRPILKKLPDNVEVIYDSAWNHVQMGGKYHHEMFYNKVVSNLPYSFIEPFLHNLTFISYDKAILMIPVKSLKFIKENGIFSSFFKPKVLLKVPKDNFYPVPGSDSVVIDLIKLPDAIEDKNPGRFLRQQMYKHENQKVKNSLMHALINYKNLVEGKKLTKNEARKIVADSDIPSSLLEDTPGPEIYDLVESRIRL